MIGYGTVAAGKEMQGVPACEFGSVLVLSDKDFARNSVVQCQLIDKNLIFIGKQECSILRVHLY